MQKEDLGIKAQATTIDFNAPEWKAELLRGMQEATVPYLHDEMRAACHEAVRKRKASKH